METTHDDPVMARMVAEISDVQQTDNEPIRFRMPELDGWECFMFGNKPGGSGWVWVPTKEDVPNWFVRYMMRICFGCTWVRK